MNSCIVMMVRSVFAINVIHLLVLKEHVLDGTVCVHTAVNMNVMVLNAGGVRNVSKLTVALETIIIPIRLQI